jgi:membrane protease YdiL (CAAX protease family)
MLPAVFFRKTARLGVGKDRAAVPVEPMHLGLRLPTRLPLYLLGSLAVILAAAYLNSFVLTWFSMGPSIAEQTMPTKMENYEIVLAFFATALIPAVCEEFLFRGVVLSNLLPYNRTAAVVISAVCFGMMHRNTGQVLYATLAGLVLGWLVIHTGSVWCSMLVHLLNNFMAVVQSVIAVRLEEGMASVLIALLDCTVLSLGLLSILWLLLRPGKCWRDEGCFGQTESALQLSESRPIPADRLMRASLSPTVIVFLATCAAVMYLYAVSLQGA